MEEDFGYDMFDTGYYDGDRYEDSRNDYDRMNATNSALNVWRDDYEACDKTCLHCRPELADEGGEDYLLDMVMEDRLSGGDVDY